MDNKSNERDKALRGLYYSISDGLCALKIKKRGGEMPKDLIEGDLFKMKEVEKEHIPQMIGILESIRDDVKKIIDLPSESKCYKKIQCDIEHGNRIAKEICEFDKILQLSLKKNITNDFIEKVNNFCEKMKIETPYRSSVKILHFTKKELCNYIFDCQCYFIYHNHTIDIDENGNYFNFVPKDASHFVRDIMYGVFAFEFAFKEDNKNVLTKFCMKIIGDNKIIKLI